MYCSIGKPDAVNLVILFPVNGGSVASAAADWQSIQWKSKTGPPAGYYQSSIDRLGSRNRRLLCVREESTLLKCLQAQEISIIDILTHRS